MSWLIQWSVATAFFVLVMAGAGYWVYAEALSGGQLVQVPDITDTPITEAAFLLAEQGLEMGKQTQVSHPTAAIYQVIAQRPEAGRVVRAGRKVYPTVSMGADFQTTPDLRRLHLEEARKTLQSSRFELASVARIPSDMPRDTVLAQDPSPGRNIPSGGSVNLLVSAGRGEQTNFMPDIRGMKVEEMERTMASYGVQLVRNEMDLPDAQEGVVLDQEPAPDSLIYAGQSVTYFVKATAKEEEQKNYETEVRHVMPYDWFDRQVRVDMVDQAGARSTLWSKAPLFDNDARATYVKGAAIRLTVPYVNECMVEVYVDGQVAKSYYLKNGRPPADPVSEN